MNFEGNLQPMAHGTEDLGKLFESDGGAAQLTENETGSFRLAAQKQCQSRLLAFILKHQADTPPESANHDCHNGYFPAGPVAFGERNQY